MTACVLIHTRRPISTVQLSESATVKYNIRILSCWLTSQDLLNFSVHRELPFGNFMEFPEINYAKFPTGISGILTIFKPVFFHWRQ